MGRMWEVAWTEDDSAIVEGRKKKMNRIALGNFCSRGNSDAVKR